MLQSIFQPAWQDFVFWGVCLVVYLVLVYTKRLPAIDSLKAFTELLSSAGGNIAVLSLFSFYFFSVSVKMILYVLSLPDDVLTKKDAIIVSGIAFVTGTAFGGSWSALLKTMTGGSGGSSPRPPSATGLSVSQTGKESPGSTEKV